MKYIAVMPNAYKDPAYSYTRKVIAYLRDLGACVLLSKALSHDIRDAGIRYYDGALPSETEMILVIGGDGSVLDAAVYAMEADLPLLSFDSFKGKLEELIDAGNLRGVDAMRFGYGTCKDGDKWKLVPVWMVK